MAGEWLTATANTNMYFFRELQKFNFSSVNNLFRFTYEISPVFILMEKEVMNKMIELVGWPEGDGIFAPGFVEL